MNWNLGKHLGWGFKISHTVCGAVVTVFALLVLLGGNANPAAAQANSALLSGIVSDSTGAVVPGAKVDATNVATGVPSETTTNNAGIYNFNNVMPGDYNIEVTKQGFARAVTSGLHIEVNQALTQDFILNPGTVKEQVSVQADTVALDTANAAIGAVIEKNTITELPLNGRDFTQLLVLSPGATPINTGQSNGGGQSNPVGTNIEPSINGAQVRSNYYYLDGIDNTEMNYDVPAIRPTVDDIAEFKVQSHNDEAQFGGVTGGIINVVTKGGTNTFNGEAWEFLRNTIFNANNPINVTPEKLVQNQYGFNGGGPIIIPHLYNGRDHSFFFGSYEGFRRAEPQAAAAYRVPTAAELTGDFSDTCTAPATFVSGICTDPGGAVDVNQLYNPFTTTYNSGTGAYTRQPILNNNLATGGTGGSSLIAPGTAAFAAAYWPAPGTLTTTPGVNGGKPYNGIDTRHSLLTQGQWSVRGDETINNSNSAFFRITNFNQPSTSPTETVNFINDRDVNAQQYVASFVHIFSPSSVLDVEFGHSELTNGTITHLDVGSPSAAIAAAGFNSSLDCNFTGGFSNCVLPSMSIPNIAGGGEGESTTLLSYIYQYRANFTKSFSRHSLSAGINWETNYFHVINTTDTITYANQTVQNPAITTYTGSYYGGLAAYFMGVAEQGGLRDTVAPLTGQQGIGFYVMDKWKVSNKLMANFGLRYDAQIDGIYGDTSGGTIYVGDMDTSFSGNFNSPQPANDPWAGSYVLQKNPPSCANTNDTAPCIPGGSFAAVIANANANPISPGVVTPANSIQVASDGHVFRPNYNGWQPRLGLAYKLDSKTSIRAGFGMFYDLWGGISQSIQNIGGTWPTIGQISSAPINGADDVAVVNWTNPISSGSEGTANAPAPTPFDNQQWYRQPNAKNPYSEQWNFGFERELEGGKTIVSANYVGSASHKLVVGGQYNTAPPGPGTPAQVVLREPYPYIEPTFLDRSIGNSSYNALQVSVSHQAARGLGYVVAYTWSKNIDRGCDGFFGGESCSTPNPYDLSGDRSVAGVNLPQDLTASFVAQSPFGTNQRFTTHSSVGDYIIGNWSLNGIVTFTSGQNFNVSESGDAANTNHDISWDNYNRPELVGNPKAISNRSIKEWFNTTAFQPSAPYTFGNTPRNYLMGDPYKNLDLSLFREFPIGETRNLQFRAEAFNVLNHPTWGNPDSNLGDSNFGQIGGTRSTERQLQLGMKLKF